MVSHPSILTVKKSDSRIFLNEETIVFVGQEKWADFGGVGGKGTYNPNMMYDILQKIKKLFLKEKQI